MGIPDRIDIRLGGVIIELEVSQHRDARPDVAEIEHLAPAVMPDDDVRHDPSCRNPIAARQTISARRTPPSSSWAAVWISFAAGAGFRYGSLRTPAISSALGSVMKTISCCRDAARWRTMCRNCPGKFWCTKRNFTEANLV